MTIKLSKILIKCLIKSRRLRWAEHVARIEEGKVAFKILTGKPTGTRHLGGPGVDGRTILEWTLKKSVSNEKLG